MAAENKKSALLWTMVILAGWGAVACGFLFALTRADVEPSTIMCRSNLKQIGLAAGLYRADYGGELPPKLQTLCDNGYLKDTGLLKCPQDTAGPAIDPRYVDVTSSFRYAPTKKLTGTGENIPMMWERTLNHTKDGVNVLFYNMRVRFTPLIELRAMIEKNRALYDKPPVMPVEP